MIRGATPTYTMQFEEGIGDSIIDIILSFRQDETDLHLKLSERQIALNGDIATCTLTQAQTLAFSAGAVERQVTVKLGGDKVQKTAVEKEAVLQSLYTEAV